MSEIKNKIKEANNYLTEKFDRTMASVVIPFIANNSWTKKIYEKLTGKTLEPQTPQTSTPNSPISPTAPNVPPIPPTVPPVSPVISQVNQTLSIPNSPPTPIEPVIDLNELVPFSKEAFQNGQKVNLVGIPGENFVNSLPIKENGKLRNGMQIIISSNIFWDKKKKPGENQIFNTEEKDFSKCTLTYRIDETDIKKEAGRWEITSQTNPNGDFVVHPKTGIFSTTGFDLVAGSLVLKKEILKNPEFKLNVQLVEPPLTDKEKEKIENKKQAAAFGAEQTKFTKLTDGIPPDQIPMIFPDDTLSPNRTLITNLEDYFKVQDKRGEVSKTKEEIAKAQAERLGFFKEFNKTAEEVETEILALDLNIKQNPTDPNSLNYYGMESRGDEKLYIQEKAKEMVERIFLTADFEPNQLLNPNPQFPNLDQVFGKLKFLLPMAAVYLANNPQTPNTNLGKIDFQGGRVDGKFPRTTAEIAALALYQFAKVKITKQIEVIKTQKKTDEETAKNTEANRLKEIENTHKTEFVGKIMEIRTKIVNYKEENGLNDEQIIELKNKMEIKYTQENANNTNPSKNITLRYLVSLLNLGGLSNITDQNASELGLDFVDQTRIDAQLKMLTEIEKACDSVITYEIARKNCENSALEFANKIKEMEKEISDIEQKIIAIYPDIEHKKCVEDLFKKIKENTDKEGNLTFGFLDILNKNDLEVRKNNYTNILTIMNAILENHKKEKEKEAKETIKQQKIAEIETEITKLETILREINNPVKNTVGKMEEIKKFLKTRGKLKTDFVGKVEDFVFDTENYTQVDVESILNNRDRTMINIYPKIITDFEKFIKEEVVKLRQEKVVLET